MNWGLILSNALYTAIGVQCVGYVLAAIGINMHFGYTGLLNFGQAAFAAVGAYSVAVSVRSWNLDWWGVMLVFLVVPLVLALLLGIPTLRLRADYLAIVTIAAAEILRLVLNGANPTLTRNFGGTDGLQGFTAWVQPLNPFDGKTFQLWKQPVQGHEAFIILIGWVLIALVSLAVYLLIRSPWGRVLKSIREDENAARSLGKNVFVYKLQSLVIGGYIGALGGLIYAVGGRYAGPNDYSTRFTFTCWTILILGGVGKVKGPIIGGIIFWLIIGITEGFLSEATKPGQEILPTWLVNNNNFGLLRFMLVGLGLALLVIFRPQGIFGDKREQAFDVR
jgi:ABC-type branched-subunit amino acid transport system permease subunit